MVKTKGIIKEFAHNRNNILGSSFKEMHLSNKLIFNRVNKTLQTKEKDIINNFHSQTLNITKGTLSRIKEIINKVINQTLNLTKGTLSRIKEMFNRTKDIFNSNNKPH